MRALLRKTGSDDAASTWTDWYKPSVFKQRAVIRSMADLLMSGLGEVASVCSTSKDIARNFVS